MSFIQCDKSRMPPGLPSTLPSASTRFGMSFPRRMECIPESIRQPGRGTLPAVRDQTLPAAEALDERADVPLPVLAEGEIGGGIEVKIVLSIKYESAIQSFEEEVL